MSLDASNVQREKIVFELVNPYIPGFSVECPMEVEQSNEEEQSPTSSKRRIDESIAAGDEKMDTSIELTNVKSKTKKNKKSKK